MSETLATYRQTDKHLNSHLIVDSKPETSVNLSVCLHVTFIQLEHSKNDSKRIDPNTDRQTDMKSQRFRTQVAKVICSWPCSKCECTASDSVEGRGRKKKEEKGKQQNQGTVS